MTDDQRWAYYLFLGSCFSLLWGTYCGFAHVGLLTFALVESFVAFSMLWSAGQIVEEEVRRLPVRAHRAIVAVACYLVVLAGLVIIGGVPLTLISWLR